jgi:hypothetical protein
MSLLILSLRDIDNTAELASSYNSTIWGNCECFGTKCQRLIFPSQLAGWLYNIGLLCAGQWLFTIYISSNSTFASKPQYSNKNLACE